MPWKTKSSKSFYKNHWMEVTEDVVENDSGKELTFGIVHKKPFALIIPWDGKYFTLVKQYRYSVGTFTLEFPAGHFEHDSIEETAKKELEEETGLRAGKIEEIDTFFLAPGHHNQVCHVFLATELTEGMQELEEQEEGMKTIKVAFEELRIMIKNGEVKDGPTLAAFGILMNLNLLE